MKTPVDGNEQQTGLGQRVEPKKPAPAKPAEKWVDLPDHPGFEREVTSGDVRRKV